MSTVLSNEAMHGGIPCFDDWASFFAEPETSACGVNSGVAEVGPRR